MTKFEIYFTNGENETFYGQTPEIGNDEITMVTNKGKSIVIERQNVNYTVCYDRSE